ncbi:hypothetical protein POM88_043031 [Heracleum sosnowskyi]|uniref:rRNA N-glycosylase n=1 Tax=Heracleum sosnowskyi TaxID=360622 RepID=A0AAD8M9R2_9APIA|nr:hypothetical protein POM88_043031 [Heracleum sosnowskyi]
MWGKPYRGKVRVLPAVDKEKVFRVRLLGNHGFLITFIRKQDIYTIAWGKEENEEKMKLHISTDALQSLKERKEEILTKEKEEKKIKNTTDRLLDDLLEASDAKIRSDDGSLTFLVPERNVQKIKLGREALLDISVDVLREMKGRYEVAKFHEYQKQVAVACWVIIQMISESSRFKPLLQFIVNGYKKGVYINSDIENMEGNWASCSSHLEDMWFSPGKLTHDQIEACQNLRLVLWDKVKDIDKKKKKHAAKW